MKKILILVIVLSSFSTFSHAFDCESTVTSEILASSSVNEKIKNLLMDFSRVDSNGDVSINLQVKKEIEDIQTQASVLADLVCR